ncbi:MAG: FAD/NAD(P)-binding protein, partial [Syntrophomonadaceae bacterium]|nr:FAD/NAD(P)-binding protein [Syntrophomonadaceae bacterium]
MSNGCSCENPLVPRIVKVVDIIEETPDVKTFHVTTDEGIPFRVMPGQLAMVSMLPVGEGMFSVSWQAEDPLEVALRRVGVLTDAMHEVWPGQQWGIRGPYGNGFPVEKCKGKNMLFVAGGIGLAPLRSFIKYCFLHRQDYGRIDILYGARSYADLCFKRELFEEWPAQPDTTVYTTIDRAEEGWNGHVGFVPTYLEEIGPQPSGTVAVICGPPIMIKLALKSMEKLGFE